MPPDRRALMSQRVVLTGATTWTVVSEAFSVVESIEGSLEFGRQTGFKPNTIKAYARGLEQWWTCLERTSKCWDAVQIHDFGNFLAPIRHNEFDPSVRQLRPAPAVGEATVRLRLRAVLGFYRYHAGRGNDVAPFLYDQIRGRSGKYLSFLEHVARRNPQRRVAIRVRVPRKEIPILTPDVISDLLDAEAVYSPDDDEWRGDLQCNGARRVWTPHMPVGRTDRPRWWVQRFSPSSRPVLACESARPAPDTGGAARGGANFDMPFCR